MNSPLRFINRGELNYKSTVIADRAYRSLTAGGDYPFTGSNEQQR